MTYLHPAAAIRAERRHRLAVTDAYHAEHHCHLCGRDVEWNPAVRERRQCERCRGEAS